MKALHLFFSTLALATILSGCQLYSYEERSSRNIEPQHNVVTVPIVADIELLSKEKITYTETFSGVQLNQFFFKNRRRKVFSENSQLDPYKYTAQAHALKQYGADFLIGAMIDVDYTNKGDILKVIVTGYPAKYKEFRKATPEDEWFINKSEK